jgi:tetratricopeptide (TPR) repeat protein
MEPGMSPCQQAALEAANKLLRVEDWEGAERVLRNFSIEAADVPWPLSVALGNALWKQAKYAEAIPVWRRAVEANPAHEMVSLGLFHCLYENDELAAALEEGRRFLRSAGPDEFPDYREVVAALADHMGKKQV